MRIPTAVPASALTIDEPVPSALDRSTDSGSEDDPKVVLKAGPLGDVTATAKAAAPRILFRNHTDPRADVLDGELLGHLERERAIWDSSSSGADPRREAHSRRPVGLHPRSNRLGTPAPALTAALARPEGARVPELPRLAPASQPPAPRRVARDRDARPDRQSRGADTQDGSGRHRLGVFLCGHARRGLAGRRLEQRMASRARRRARQGQLCARRPSRPVEGRRRKRVRRTFDGVAGATGTGVMADPSPASLESTRSARAAQARAASTRSGSRGRAAKAACAPLMPAAAASAHPSSEPEWPRAAPQSSRAGRR